ncbi:hypothetical protein EXIGLDRAFT_732387 [Exidia glandulosa HHB12029]|uniref:Uncharacterized protein n=1 Tax=Exidia glandulosa HHB12029 TaxID=1314781 RepID=A0A165KST6_EXIGL|nr:hypothetical protein EXIGLDRAFT_732387 [Exidia glandulosa HHB12029]
MSFNTITNSESARFRYFQARQAQIAHWQATSAPTVNYAPVEVQVGPSRPYHYHVETTVTPTNTLAGPAVDKDLPPLPQEQELDEVLVVIPPSPRKQKKHRRRERTGAFIIPLPHYDVPLSDIPRRRRP